MEVDVTITPPGEAPPVESEPQSAPAAPSEPSPEPQPIELAGGIKIVPEAPEAEEPPTVPPPAGVEPPQYPNPFAQPPQEFVPPQPFVAPPQLPPEPPNLGIEPDPDKFAENPLKEIARVAAAAADLKVAKIMADQRQTAMQHQVVSDIRAGSVHYQKIIASDPASRDPKVAAWIDYLVKGAQNNAFRYGPEMSGALAQPEFFTNIMNMAKHRAAYRSTVSVVKPSTQVLSSSGGQGAPSAGGGELSPDEDAARIQFGLTKEQWIANKKRS